MTTFIFQIINHEHGTRTTPFGATMADLATLLDKSEIPEKDYVLLLANADDPDDESAARFPLITVKTFLQQHNQEVSENE